MRSPSARHPITLALAVIVLMSLLPCKAMLTQSLMLSLVGVSYNLFGNDKATIGMDLPLPNPCCVRAEL